MVASRHLARPKLCGCLGMVERHADVAQLVEHQLPKLRVAGSIPVVRLARTSRNPLEEAGFGVSEALLALPPETARNRLGLALTGAQLARAFASLIPSSA